MKELKNVAVFTAAYVLLSALAAYHIQNWEFVYYIVVVCIFVLLTVFMYSRVRLSLGVIWALSIWGLLHMMGGLVPVGESVLYSWWIVPGFLKYDHVIHAYGFGTTTVLCWQCIRSRLTDARPTLGVLSLCVFAGMGLGALNEIIEFIAVLLLPNTNVGGYMNTGWDLVANLVGCVAVAFWIHHHDR